MLDHSLAGAVVDEGEECQNDGELRHLDAAIAVCITDEPEMADPGNLGEDEAADEGRESMLLVIALDKDMARGAVADKKSESCNHS